MNGKIVELTEVTANKRTGFVLELLLYFAAVVLTIYWFVITMAHVNEQALHTLYLPFVRSLRVLDYLSFDGLEILRETHHGNYPYGIYVLPLFFYLTGCTQIGLSWPFLLCVLLLLFFAMTCFLAFPDGRRSMSLFMLIFSFPFFQISLKSFSPHSWNVAAGFMMVILLESLKGEIRGRKWWFKYVCGILCGIFCVALKHFGALIVILYFLCRFCVALCQRKPFLGDLANLFLCLLGGSCFYSLEGFWSYVKQMFLHNPYFGLWDGFSIIILFVILFLVSIWWFRRRQASEKGIILAGRGFFVLSQFLFLLVYLALSGPAGGGSSYFHLFFILFSLGAFWTLFIVPASAMAIYAFFYAALGTAWFFFLFAYHIDFFVFPFLLLFYLAVKEGLSRFFLLFFILCGLFVSNNFEFVQQNLEKSGLGFLYAGIEERIFNSFSWHPLDWKPMQMQKIRQEMEELIHPYLLQGRVYGLAANMNFKAQQEMNWPPYFFVDGLFGEEERFLSDIGRYGLENCFLRWHEEGRVIILLEAMNHWDQYESGLPESEQSVYISGLELGDGPELRADFASFMGDQYLKFLRKTGLLSAYDSYLIPPEYPFLLLHIRKNSAIDTIYKYEEPIINMYNEKNLNL